jgi:hypothetical protein
MRDRVPRTAYPAKLKIDSWQIVIPTMTKTSPICFNADFQSRADAEAWMRTEEARRLLAVARATGRLPVRESPMKGASQVTQAEREKRVPSVAEE